MRAARFQYPGTAEANNRTLFAHFRSIDAWKGIYKGKTDYLYYFLLLAVEKLKPGGTLCVITPAGWMNAGAADFLRERLATELTRADRRAGRPFEHDS